MLILLTIMLEFISTDAGFSGGGPCSPRNTAYLESPTVNFPQDAVKCIDITGMRAPLIFDKIFPITEADTLYADHMNLTGITRGMFTFMPNIELADFTGNNITRIPPPMNVITPKLTTLLLSENRIRIPKRRPLMRSLTIKTLMLSKNYIQYLQPFTFAKVPELSVLYLDGNLLESVSPKNFLCLEHLKFLDLRNNYLVKVPPRDLMPRTLIVYNVKGNRLNFDNELDA